MGKKLDTEMKDVPVVRDFRAEVDKVLREKIAAVIKGFQDEREKDIDELARLNQVLEDLKKKQGPMLTERATLVCGIMGVGTKGVGGLDQKLRGLEKQIKSCQGQTDEVFSRLTSVPKLDFPFLNFLSRYESKP
jgi:hydrogenase maturation factor HypE